MALFIVQNFLVSTDGIPLGLLTSGYRVGQLGYVFSKPFGAPMFLPRLRLSKATFVGLFFLLFTFLALSISPSSTTLVIPQLGWHDLPNPFSNVVMPLANEVSKDSLWPSSVNISFATNCDSSYGLFCPGFGLPTILDWVENWRTSGLETTLSFQHNDLRRVLSHTSQQVNNTLISSTDATTPSDAVTNTIDNFWAYIKANHDVGPVYHTFRPQFNTSDDYPLFQPFVSTRCLSYDDLGDLEIVSTEVFDSSMTDSAIEEIKALNTSNPDTSAKFAWIATNSSSVGAVVGLPYFNISDTGEPVQRTWWSICDISASWNRTTLHFDPEASSDIEFDLSEGVYGGPSPITICTDFLDSVNFIIDNKDNETIMQRIWVQYLEQKGVPGTNNKLWRFAPQTSDDFESSSRIVSLVVSKTISVVLADILSSISKNSFPILINSVNQTHYTYINLGTQYGNSTTNATSLTPLNPDFVKVGFQVSRYGYISGNTSLTMTFAITVNLIYMLTNVIYLVVFVLIFKCLRVKSVTTWTSIEELLVLAFLSRKPRELDNGGAGVLSKQIWGQNVRVRANADNSVEMVFQEYPGMKKIFPEVEYG